MQGNSLSIFTINEGPQVILQEVEIIGNTAFNIQKLLSFFEAEKARSFRSGKTPFYQVQYPVGIIPNSGFLHFSGL